MNQSTNTVFLVSPSTFGFNPETAKSNVFQHDLHLEKNIIQQKAQKEWEGVCSMLVKEKINVIAIMDTLAPVKPDALFPNNWITTHESGKIILYPLMAPNRRAEKRLDIVYQLTQKYKVKEIIDLSFYEKEGLYLEGTGSMVFDRQNKIIYSCLSARTAIEPLEHVAKLLGYQVVPFQAFDQGAPIYHTNVFMSVGQRWATICKEAIPDKNEIEKLIHFFKKTGKEIIYLTQKQIDAFAGNILELETPEKLKKIIMSKTTYESLSEEQIEQFSSFGDICYSDVSTIEQVGGGGIRCLLAELFLQPL
jgi:hypothetical protein